MTFDEQVDLAIKNHYEYLINHDLTHEDSFREGAQFAKSLCDERVKILLEALEIIARDYDDHPDLQNRVAYRALAAWRSGGDA